MLCSVQAAPHGVEAVNAEEERCRASSLIYSLANLIMKASLF